MVFSSLKALSAPDFVPSSHDSVDICSPYIRVFNQDTSESFFIEVGKIEDGKFVHLSTPSEAGEVSVMEKVFSILSSATTEGVEREEEGDEEVISLSLFSTTPTFSIRKANECVVIYTSSKEKFYEKYEGEYEDSYTGGDDVYEECFRVWGESSFQVEGVFSKKFELKRYFAPDDRIFGLGGLRVRRVILDQMYFLRF